MFEAFEQALHEALSHLYDPAYRPFKPLYALVGCDPGGGALAVQAAIGRAIEDMKPEDGTPPSAQTKRVYDVLHSRFMLKLTQRETAERLHISLSTVQRIQRQAIHMLMKMLWERSQAQGPFMEGHAGKSDKPRTEALDWHAQMRQELASLRSYEPDSVTDIVEVLQGVLELEDALASGHDVHIEVGYIQPGLVAAIHSSALRQMLIAALGRLVQNASPGPIRVFARLMEGDVRITVRGAIAREDALTEEDLTHGILVPEGTRVEGGIQGDHAFLWISVPSLGQIVVLAVDDNSDMLHFYRRCATGTRYRIVGASGGQEALERIKASPPDVIVLDVMLPDVDGWKLLMQLHEDPTTRSIPVIVCSVVREEALARSLGAALYLPKPIGPPQFVEALNQVRPQTAAKALEEPVNTLATD